VSCPNEPAGAAARHHDPATVQPLKWPGLPPDQFSAARVGSARMAARVQIGPFCTCGGPRRAVQRSGALRSRLSCCWLWPGWVWRCRVACSERRCPEIFCWVSPGRRSDSAWFELGVSAGRTGTGVRRPRGRGGTAAVAGRRLRVNGIGLARLLASRLPDGG